MTTFLTSLAVGVMVAIVSAYVTVRLALSRFRAEQWWTRKADAYASILEALHYSKDCDVQYMREFEEGRILNSKDELAERGREASRQIRKAIDTSNFLLSSEASAVLEELGKGLAEADSANEYYDHLDTSIDAATKCLKQLPAIVKRDLGIK